MLTNFQCEKCYFRNIQGRDPDVLSEKYMILLVIIRRDTLDEFLSMEPGTVKGNLTMVKWLGKVAGDKLVMKTWLPPMVPYTIVYEVGMSLACTTLIFYLIKGRTT